MAELELRGISKSFSAQPVLRDISLQVPNGSFTILLGPSGCGKSTLLRIIAGLDNQTSGQVHIDGRAVDHLPPAERDIAMVFQQYALYPHLSVRENLAFALTIRRTPRQVIDERIAEAAQLLDIEPLLDRKPKDLSGGQRQRVAMGRAIVRKPKLFLFDEPLSNLDAQLRTSMRIELKKLQQRLQATMIYVTHDQVEAMTLGDRIVVIEGGRIRQADDPHRTYTAPADPFVASFIGTPPMNLWEGTLTTKDGATVFRSHDLTLPLPARLSAPHAADNSPPRSAFARRTSRSENRRKPCTGHRNGGAGGGPGGRPVTALPDRCTSPRGACGPTHRQDPGTNSDTLFPSR
jgi:multiple sugar transport system ATP-binding protein